MKQPAPPKPRKHPKQSRSLLLVQSIQDACLKILQQEGPDQLTTQRIADVAGINIASLYQYFPNKEAVLSEVFEAQIRQYTASARLRFEEILEMSRTSFEATLQAIVEMEVEQRLLLSTMEPQFYRDYQHSFDIHGRLNELTISLDNPAWQEWFPRFLSHHSEQLRSQDLELLSRIASYALSGTLRTTVEEEPQLLETEEFKEELLTLLLSFLRK